MVFCNINRVRIDSKLEFFSVDIYDLKQKFLKSHFNIV